MATIASLIVNVAANTAQLQKDVEQIHGTLGKVGAAVAAAFSFSEVASAADKVVSMAGHVDDLAKKAGITAEAVQELDFAAKQSGSSFEAVASALAQMGNRLVEGDKGAVSALESLGLSFEAIRAMSPDAAFEAIGQAIAGVEDPMLRSNLAMDLFGRTGADLLPVLTSDIGRLRDTARETGLVVENDLVAAGDELGDSWDRMQTQLDALLVKSILPLLEVFLKLPEPLQMVTGLAINMAPAFSNIGIAILAAGGPAAAMAALSSAAGVVATFFLTTLPAAFSALLPFLGPAGLIAVGIGAVYLAWKNWDKITAIVSGLYTAVKEWLIDKMKAVWDGILQGIENVKRGFQFMYDAVVGNSYVPDMVNRIAEEFARLDSVMVQPTQTSTSLVAGLFGSLGDFVADQFGSRMRRTVSTFQDIWKAGRSGMQGILKLMTSDFTGFIGGIMAGIQIASAAIKALKNLFSGGEEAQVVNPLRDTFLSQFGPPGTGPGSGFHNLAAMLTSFGAGEGGGGLFSAMTAADTEAKFRSAAQAIVDFITQAGGSASINFHAGGMVPGTGEVNARLLGGERVQSRQEVGEFRQMVTEMRGLRTDIIRLVEEFPGQAAAAAQIRRGLGVSYVG